MSKKNSVKKSQEIPAQKALPKVSSNSMKIIGAVVIILISTFIAFQPSLKCEFTNWDDPTYVVENQLLRNTPDNGMSKIFSPKTFVSCNYHPITIASLAMDYQKVKLEPYRYHLVNIVFHLLNTILVFWFIYLLSNKRMEAALIVSLIFGIHPMHVESVTWVSERKDVLYTFFFLFALAVYPYYVNATKNKLLLYLAVLILFVLSCLSKAMAVVLPVVLVLIDFYSGREFNKKTILEKVPFFAVSMILGLLAVEAQRGEAIASFETFTIFQRMMFASYGLLGYIEKLFLPIHLSALYPYPLLIENRLPYIYYVAPVVVLLLLGGVTWSLKKTKLILFGVGFYAVTVAMVLQFVSVGIAIMADRYSYIPYIGLLFIIAMGFSYLMENNTPKWKSLKPVAIILLIAVTPLLIWLTRERTKVWQNSETLWTDVIKQFPIRGAEVAFKNRGNYLADKKEFEKALVDYNNYILLKGDDPKIYTNRGNIFGLQQKFDLALADYSKAIQLQKDNNIEAYLNRGITYSMMKQPEKALADYDLVLQMSPGLFKVYQNRAYTYMDIGDNAHAIEDYTNVIKVIPDDANAYFYRGLAYYKSGKRDEAIADNLKAVELKPDFSNAYFNLSVLYKDAAEATKDKTLYKTALANALKAKELHYEVPANFMEELKQKGGG